LRPEVYIYPDVSLSPIHILHSLLRSATQELWNHRRATGRSSSSLISLSPDKLTLASPSSSIEILEVLTITPLAAIDPESPSSCHPTDVEEENSPLQQSTIASSQPMVDSYLEDITSEAKENAEDQTVEDMVEEEEQDGRARAEETEQGGGFEAEEVEQTPVNLHGY
jgi:hypothetical protein